MSRNGPGRPATPRTGNLDPHKCGCVVAVTRVEPSRTGRCRRRRRGRGLEGRLRIVEDDARPRSLDLLALLDLQFHVADAYCAQVAGLLLLEAVDFPQEARFAPLQHVLRLLDLLL